MARRMVGKRYIVKISRPLEGDKSVCLVYDRHRNISTLQPYSEEIRHLFKKDGAQKVFHRAVLQPNGLLVINERVGDQPW